MEENVGSSVADDVCILVWAIWSNWWVILFHTPLFSGTTRSREAFHADPQLRKSLKGLCCQLLQCLFFLVFTLSQTLWFDTRFPKLLVILFSDLNSYQFSNEANTATWGKDGYLCLWLSSEFSEFSSTCTSSLVFRKPINKNAFVAWNEPMLNNLCWSCFACTLMGKLLLISYSMSALECF